MLTAPSKAASRRQYARTAVDLPGQLYLIAEESAQSCRVTDVSASGARVTCADEVPPLSAFVILHIEGFGRFEAVTANFLENTLGLRFLISDRRCTRLLRQIAAFAQGGMAAAARTGVQEAS